MIGHSPNSQSHSSTSQILAPDSPLICLHYPNTGVTETGVACLLISAAPRQLYTVALSTRIGLIFATKAGIRGNVHKKPLEIRCAVQTNRFLKGFELFLRHYEVTN